MTHPLAGRKQSPEHIARRLAAMRASGAFDASRVAQRIDKLKASGHFERLAVFTVARNKARAGTPHTEETKAKIAAALKGKQNCLGHKPTEEHRRKLADYWAKNRERHNHYVDGKGHERTSARHADMSRIEYRLWREAVFKRDDWTCVDCGTRGGKLHADHIKPYSKFPELRYDVANGRALCVPCHRATPTFGGKTHTIQCEVHV